MLAARGPRYESHGSGKRLTTPLCDTHAQCLTEGVQTFRPKTMKHLPSMHGPQKGSEQFPTSVWISSSCVACTAWASQAKTPAIRYISFTWFSDASASNPGIFISITSLV